MQGSEHVREIASLQAIMTGDARAPCPALSSPAQAFLSACLQRDPAARPSISDLLAHKWIQVGSTQVSATEGAKTCVAVGCPYYIAVKFTTGSPSLLSELGSLLSKCVQPCSTLQLFLQYGLCEKLLSCSLWCRVYSQMIGPYCCPRAQLPAVWRGTAQRSLRPSFAPFWPAPAERMPHLPALSGVQHHPCFTESVECQLHIRPQHSRAFAETKSLLKAFSGLLCCPQVYTAAPCCSVLIKKLVLQDVPCHQEGTTPKWT